MCPVAVLVVRSPRHDVAWAENHRSDGLAAAYATDTSVVRRGKRVVHSWDQKLWRCTRTPFNDVADTQPYRDAVPFDAWCRCCLSDIVLMGLLLCL